MSVVLSEHLPLLATAPDGVAKLRNLILGLAISGKLVAQDPNDLPAKLAFERLRICRKKPVEPLLTEFRLPSSWLWCQVGDSNVLRTGATPSTLKTENYGGEVRWLVSGDIHKREIFDCNGRISDLGLASSNCKILPTNSVLIALNGQGKTRATVAILRVPAACNQSLVSMTPVSDEVLLPEFLYLNLRFRYYEIREITGQKQRRGLNMGLVGDLSISLPPVPEQHRIVAKVDELMALCDRLEAEQTDAETAHARLVETLLGTLTQSTDAADLAANWQRLANHFDTLFTTESSLDALKQTILQLAVMGKLVPQDPKDEPTSELLNRIAKERARLEAEGICKKSKPLPSVREDELSFVAPRGWSWCRLQSAFDVRDGTHDSPKFLPKGIPFLTSKNIYGGKLDLTDLKFISESDHLEFSKRSKVDRDDILFAMIGSIGNPVIVDTDLVFSFKNMALFKYFSRTLSSPEYLRIFLAVIASEMRAKAAGGVQSFVSLGTIRSQPIALPPLSEQHRIVAKVDELMALCDALKADLAESRARQARLSATLIESALAAA